MEDSLKVMHKSNKKSTTNQVESIHVNAGAKDERTATILSPGRRSPGHIDWLVNKVPLPTVTHGSLVYLV